MVSNLVEQRALLAGTRKYGRAFAHFILQECRAYRRYCKLDFPNSFGRTAGGSEVGLILDDAEVALKIKTSPMAFIYRR